MRCSPRANTSPRSPTGGRRSVHPSDAAQLRADVDRLLADAEPSTTAPPKGLIAPHAGYVYSGPIAATAYASLRARVASISKVVLLGPAHRVAVRGLALPAAERFATRSARSRLTRSSRPRSSSPRSSAARRPRARALARGPAPVPAALLPRFTLLPVVVGDASPAEVAQVLERVWGGPETPIVISSDLSHYHPYAEAAQLDAATTAWIASTHAPGLDPHRACGARCIDGLIELGRRHPLTLDLLDLRNSGDTAGSRDQVVGYAAFAIREGRRHDVHGDHPMTSR